MFVELFIVNVSVLVDNYIACYCALVDLNPSQQSTGTTGTTGDFQDATDNVDADEISGLNTPFALTQESNATGATVGSQTPHITPFNSQEVSAGDYPNDETYRPHTTGKAITFILKGPCFAICRTTRKPVAKLMLLIFQLLARENLKMHISVTSRLHRSTTPT